MAVNGRYLAWRIQIGLSPYFRAYEQSALTDALSGFANLAQRADNIAESAFKRFGARPADENFDGDMSLAAEWAQEEGQAFYEVMTGMRQATINLFAVGLFHLLEQQLANLCYDGAFHVPPPESRLEDIVNWYQRHFKLDLRQFSDWATIDELRLLANTVKHASGPSESKLRIRRPELFQNPALARSLNNNNCDAKKEPLRLPLAGDDLFVTEELFAEYATAVNNFVKALAQHFATDLETDYPCDAACVTSELSPLCR